MKRYFFLVIIFHFFLFHCADKRNSIVLEDYFLSAFLIESNHTDLYQACSAFYTSEYTCVSNPLKISEVCNTTEFTRLKKGISPQSLASDAVLTDYYKCWSSCNLNFNEEIDCKNSKFNTNSEYRSKQRIEITSPYQNWQYCYASCNSGNSIYENLSNTTYTEDQ